MKKFLDPGTRLKLLQLVIILIPFSYQPRIYLDSLQGLSMEISFVQIAGAAFVLSSLQSIFRNRKKLIENWAIRLLGIYIILNWVSILWSADAVRTIVLSTYWTFLFAVVLAIAALFIDKKIKQKEITNPLIIGTVIGLTFGIWQYLGVMLGLDSSLTLIRHAYNAELFGFPRIQAFALEPQFYANGLITPALYLSWRVLLKKWNTYHYILLAWVFGAFLLTVSRGAMAGFVVAMAMMIGIFIFDKKVQDKLKIFGRYFAVLLASFIVVLGLIYVSGEIQGDHHNGPKSVETFIDHMSHNVIDINLASENLDQQTPEHDAPTQAPPEQKPTNTSGSSHTKPTPSSTSSNIDGLVEESTTGRLYMYRKAIEIGTDNVAVMFFGVGVGSFGPALQSADELVTINNHVVNNLYLEIFAEQGIIGLSLFLGFIGALARDIYKKTRVYALVFGTILAAYLVQYFFFSLQTNVIQVWLFVGVVIGVSLTSNKAEAKKQ